MTGEVFLLFIKTPNNNWNLIVPRISIIQDFINMTIIYESLNPTKVWGAFDTYNNLQMTGNNSLLEWESTHNSPNRINMEMEIKEIV